MYRFTALVDFLKLAFLKSALSHYSMLLGTVRLQKKGFILFSLIIIVLSLSSLGTVCFGSVISVLVINCYLLLLRYFVDLSATSAAAIR